MRTFAKIALGMLFACLFFVTAAFAQFNHQVVRESDRGQTITVTQGTQIDLLLDENTSVATSWGLKQVSGDSVTFYTEDHLDGDAIRPDGTFSDIYEGVFQTEKVGTSVIEINGLDENFNPNGYTFTVTIVVK